MTKHARRLTIAIGVLGVIALGAAGPSLAHRIVSNITTPHVAGNAATMDDDDYVETLIKVTAPGR